ncbi:MULTISPECIES: hypothetical protein [unclassified Microcoleus]
MALHDESTWDGVRFLGEVSASNGFPHYKKPASGRSIDGQCPKIETKA